MTSGASRGVVGTAIVALRASLANGAIRRLQFAWASGIAADSGLLLALLVVAYQTGGPAAAGILTAIRMVPAVAAGPLAGAAVASRPPAAVLLTIHVVRTLAALAIGGLLVAEVPVEWTWPFLALIALLTGFVRPIHVGSVPALATSPEELVTANVATSLGEGLGTFAGPLLTGGLLATLGAPAACLAAAGLFGAAAVATLGLANAFAAGPEPGSADRTSANPIATLRTGLASLARRRGPAAVIAGFTAQVVVRGMLTTLIVVAAIELLGMGEPGAGLLNAALGAGALGGGLLAMGIISSSRLGSAFALALAGWGLPIAIIGLLPVPAVAVAALLAVGLSNAVLDVLGFSLLQRGVPTAERVPVFGVLETVAAIGAAAGGLVAPILIERLGTQGSLAVAGAILPIAAVAIWPWIHAADGESVVPARQLALIRGIPLFAPLTLTAVERLAGALQPVRFADGEALIREDEPGDRYLILAEGRATVTSRGRAINELAAGSGCGEISLIRDVPRTATVTAQGPVSGFALARADFLAAIAGPTTTAAASALIEERLARSA